MNDQPFVGTNSDLRMMTFSEQLEKYPAIHELWKTKPKKLPPPVSPPWRIYARKEAGGRWGRKEFDRYVDAYRFVRDRLDQYYDISITSKRQGFTIPTRTVRVTRGGRPVMVTTARGKQLPKTKIVPIKPPPAHEWCIFCRRFTMFGWFLTHHAFPSTGNLRLDPTVKRCTICGVGHTLGVGR